MIDFACKKIDINETIRCSLNLTKAEFKIFEFFMKNPAKRFESKEIAENLELRIVNSTKVNEKNE